MTAEVFRRPREGMFAEDGERESGVDATASVLELSNYHECQRDLSFGVWALTTFPAPEV